MGNTYNEHVLGQTLHNGEYLIQRILGHGGMGRVYLATHTELQAPFALKQARADQWLSESVLRELDAALHGEHGASSSFGGTLPGEFPRSGGAHTDRFLREALLLSRLQHRAIPTLYDYFFEDGYWYLVMDYIPGSTLAAYLRRHAPLPPLEALNYALQLCDVLEYLHRQSPPIIFRDLKPSNIILIPDGTLMLIDFGIARYFKPGQTNATGDFGSPGYASPEQYHGDGQTDERSDLYSLGVILHEMITGAHPFTSGALFDSPRQRNPAISAALGGLVTLATRSEPHYRFQSARTFYQAIERVYSIEERRAYERHLLKIKGIEQAAAISRRGKEQEEPGQYSTPTVELAEHQPEAVLTATIPDSTPQAIREEQGPPLLFDLEQRQQTREALLYLHHQRQEQLDFEQQLLFVDESLQRRVSTPLAYNIPVSTEGKALSRPLSHPPHRFRQAIQFSFLLTITASLILTSLLTYMHEQHPPTLHPVLSHGQVIQARNVNSVNTIATGTIARTASPPAPRHAPAVTSTWQALSSLPLPEADNTATYVKVGNRDYIYMSGGYLGPDQSLLYDRHLYRYDIQAARWEQLAVQQLPGMLNNAAVSDGNGHLFFTVGYATDTYAVTSLLYMYQFASNTIHAIIPPDYISLGFGASMVIDTHGHLFISQGYLSAGNPGVVAGTGWYRYDIATGSWHTLAPLPAALGYVLLAASSDGTILLQGGATDAGQSRQSSSIYRYAIDQNRWFQVRGRTGQPISGAASCLLNTDNLVVMGGYDATRRAGQNHAWLVNLRTLHWTALHPSPAGGSLLGAAACDGHDHAYLVRGADDPSHPTKDFWRLTVGIQG